MIEKKNMRGRGVRGLMMATVVLLFAGTQVFAQKTKTVEPEPDYTKGAKAQSPPWALGSTGAFGYIWHTNSRMIQIASVSGGSPADGKLKELDVILGISSPQVKPGSGISVDATGKGGEGGRFTWESRKALSAAITEAEKSGGKLVLNIWRPVTKTVIIPKKGKQPESSKLELVEPVSGENMQVTIELPVKGAFSATSPWECEKTKVLIDDAAQSIVKSELKANIPGYLDALGLLATGEEKYLPIVAKLARDEAKKCEALDIMGEKGMGTWVAGYLNLFLAEYYLLTKDEQVMPGLKSLPTYLSYGQDGVGTWSHGMAYVKVNGLYGPSMAYGAMNQISTVCAMSLVLAQKCGITTKPVNDAVNRSKQFFRYFVDKGTVPYGDHDPAINHDNNGRNSSSAVLFDLLGDKDATQYFSRMSLASHNIREVGHTGHFFAWQWGALSASRGGPAAAQAFVEKTRWFTEMERRADGSSVYQYQLKKDPHKYRGWSTTGQRLMQHCLPRKVLYITGKNASSMTPLTSEEIKATLDAATFNPTGLPTKELLNQLGSWSLVVRRQAAVELGKREDNVVEDLIAMLDSPNRYARYGAATALRYCGRQSEKAVDKLIDKVENDKDMTMRYYAVHALALPNSTSINPNMLGKASMKATPALLKLAAVHDEEQDPMHKLSAQIASVILQAGQVSDVRGFYPGGKGTDKLDRALLIPALKAWLLNTNGGARTVASSIYPYLSEKDLEQLWPVIYVTSKVPAPSNVMFSGGVMANGNILLAKHGFKEGLTTSLDYLYKEGWGKFGRVPPALEALSYYGSAVKPHLEDIRTKEYEPFVKGRDPKERRAAEAAWQKIQANINKDVMLKSIEPYLKGADVKPPEKIFPPQE